MHHGARLSNGQKLSAPMIRDTVKTPLAQIRSDVDFPTLEAYRYL
jgi:hypothetical protein